MKITYKNNRITLSFRTKREALEVANYLDSMFQLNKDEQRFYSKLSKRRVAGVE